MIETAALVESRSDIAKRLNAQIFGSGERTMMFAHGFGCDQNMWRYVSPAFEGEFRTVLFDYVGSGGSDLSAYDADKYASLDGYADDLIALARYLNVEGGVFVGHSVSAMIGIMAAKCAPELFSKLVLVAPSPCYIDDGDYTGGFSRDQILELLAFLDSNHMGWSAAMAPVIMATRTAPTQRGTGRQLLSYRSRSGQEFRAYHIPVRLPGRSGSDGRRGFDPAMP